ncbi:hypothetical protein PRZ48_012564 [Zasmidium cellare]|uniref:Uncharacterized protein n=1 Tax=Zasmidium cellare TaxID=395010 RepID=A0ABR0E585_ZASCE|nr:hypothetical protein PRZ48_012564 [Zasmidium cellare]
MKSKRDGMLDTNRAITRSRAAKIRKELGFEVIEAAVDPHAGARRRPIRTNRQTPSNRTNRPPQQSRLFNLAPELRNKVWEFALVGVDAVEITEISEDTPALVRTSRQTRAESRDLFLALNSFTFICKDADFSPLWRFMRNFNLMNNPARLELLGPLTIFCHGRMFPSSSSNKPFTSPREEDWDAWDIIIEQLKATGLNPKQVLWLPWLPVKQNGGRTLGFDEFRPGEAAAMKFIFFDYFLERLLEELHFVSSKAQALSAAVHKELENDWERLGVEEDAAEKMWRYLGTNCQDRDVIYAARQRRLIAERNDLAEEIADCADIQQRPAEPLVALLCKLVNFDLRHGAAIHRDPAHAIRLHGLVKAKAEKMGETLSTDSVVFKHVQMMSETDDEVDEDREAHEPGNSETEEESRVRGENEAVLDELHDEHGMAWRVEDYAYRVGVTLW